MADKIIPYHLHTELNRFDEKRILILTNSEKNLIALARKDQDAYLCYKKLLEKDYILYFHEHGVSKFYKRTQVVDLWKRKDLHQFKDLFYTLTPPSAENTNSQLPNKLLVIFSCMPVDTDYANSIVSKRMFPDFFMSLQKYLVKNVYIMRIMDLNASHGSHYCNTINYPTMETDLQDCIQDVVDSLSIQKQDIVFYGVSKGGTGALLHGSAMDTKLLAVDPILHLGEYNQKNDSHFLKGLRKEDLREQLHENLLNCHEVNKFVFYSPAAKFNYQILADLNASCLTKIEILDSNITHHGNVSRNCVPQQVMVLNKLLSNLI